MSKQIHIFVEGAEDERFLQSYLSHLGLPKAEIVPVGGKSTLGAQKNEISIRVDDGGKVLIIFDADEDCRKSKSYIEQKLQSLTFGLFLFPNNRDNGALENLLEKIITPQNEGIFDCFEDYKRCLNLKNKGYDLPGPKGKIYAYREALGILPKRNRNEKNYFNNNHWNFDSPALAPLKAFLEKSFS